MTHKILIAVVVTILAFGISYAGEINSCVDITEPGVYYLTSNIYKSDSGPCINIFSSNVYLLCNGYSIYGNYDPWYGSGPVSYGVVVSQASNVEIHDCVLHNFNTAIVIDRSSNVYVYESEIYNNTIGIGTAGANSNVIIMGNEIHHNVEAGAILYGVSGAYVTPIYATDSIKRNFFYSNPGWSIKLINSQFSIIGNLFLDRVPLRIENSNGYVADNGFTGNFEYFNYISGTVYFYTGPFRNNACNFNYLLGCGRGGNYYSTYSINCMNNNKDSFCDSGYSIPIFPSGPTIIDSYPLAYPQPYLKKPTLPSSVSLLPGGYVDINIGISWNYLINPPNIQCTIDPPLTCQFVSHNCNFNQQDGSCQYTYRISAPSNTPIGGYNANFVITSGDCKYEKDVDVNVYSQACSGTVSLTLNPNRVRVGESFTATISGLSNCGGTAYIRYGGCDGYTFGSCSVSGSGCSVSISTSEMLPGNYLLYGCFDINLDGSYDSGEYDTKNLEIYEEVGPSLPQNITSCGEITSSGYYSLNEDIYSNMSSCIKISASNVILDCQRKTISSGTKNEIGILVTGNNNKIMHCNVYGFNNGIKISGKNNDVMYSNIIGNVMGILVDGAAENTNVYTTDFTNNNYGIYSDGSSGIYVSCERGKLYTNPDVINVFSGHTNNSIYLKNVNYFIITCSDFQDDIPLKIINSNGYVFDNMFRGSFSKVDVSGNVRFTYSYKVQNVAGTNVMLGCGGGGNYYINYSGCRNNNLDSFCDNRVTVPGTNIYDTLPLAYPQPYLKWPSNWPLLSPSNVDIEPGSTESVRIPISWNYKIKDVSASCSSVDPVNCKIEKKGCDFNVENGDCYLDVIISVPDEPPNTNYTGIYPLNVTMRTGDCVYTLFGNVTVYKIIYPQLYPDIPFLSIPFIALALIFGFGLAMEVEANKRGSKSNGMILISFILVGIIALVLLKMITSFVLSILVIFGALLFGYILIRLFGGR